VEGFIKKIKAFFSQDLVVVIIIFIIAALIRSIPEIKAGNLPIGYDTFNTYVAELVTYHGSLINWLRTANLIYFIFLPFKLIGLNPDLIIKIFGPIFFASLTVTFYFWTRYFLQFSKIKAFLASILIIVQLATLRLSWDLYRNELGLIFFFLALINLLQIAKRKNLILFLIFGVLVIFSNELVTAILLITVVVLGLARLYRKKIKEFALIALALIIFAMIFTLVLSSSGQSLYDSHIIFTSEKNNLLWRYVYQYQKEMSYQTLFDNIAKMFWLFYGFILPFALYGFWICRKNLILTTITLWLLIGTFSSLIFAGTGIIVWERWLIMLAFPFAAYAVEGIFKLGEVLGSFKKWAKHWRLLSWTLAIIFWLGFISLFLYRAVPFLSKEYHEAKPPLANDILNEYFPRTMVHNSVGIWKVGETLDCIKWLNENVPSGAAVIVDNRWRGLVLTNFDLDNRYIITNAWSEQWPRQTYEYAVEKGFKNVYLIWNTSRDIRYFDLVYSSGNLGVYKSKPLKKK
jgi:hypothetical protein